MKASGERLKCSEMVRQSSPATACHHSPQLLLSGWTFCDLSGSGWSIDAAAEDAAARKRSGLFSNMVGCSVENL